QGMDAPAHVLVFPWPLQGHINCMLHLTAALLDAGFRVTFLHTEHNLSRLARAALPPGLRLLSVPDGLPDDHPRSVRSLKELTESMFTTGSAAYRALLLSLRSDSDAPPLTCVIADGIMPFAVDIAEELGVPALAFRTASACSYLAYLSVPTLVELGEVPFPADDPVRGVPGMEGFLRRRDLPRGVGRSEDGAFDPMLLAIAEGIAHAGKARALILNTAASMEGPALARIAPHMRDLFAIGPLHAEHDAAASLWSEDDSCMAWLDGHGDRSVVYVSLGSLAVISHEQFTEFLAGLVATGYAFLWVLRPDMVKTTGSVLREAVKEAGSKARVVEWAPQRGVLRHRAVGCFLTHGGWNSTLEAAAEGVPMVCWPFFADQQINSRFVGAVWRTGLDMKDLCNRAIVQGKVREAMESGELRGRAHAMAQQLKLDVAVGGSSSSDLERLVGFIRELRAREPMSY
uniref:Glycosyltransferase n=1 Tax=Aegilops tauschii subsp. strangulata TaxID=200361 RepID=A0A453STT6_AEGTS